MGGLSLFLRACRHTLGKLCRQALLLAGLALFCAALAFLAGQAARDVLTDGVSFSGITLAVTAPEGDAVPELLAQYLGKMTDLQAYCTIEAMGEAEALAALADGSVTAVLALPEDFVHGVQVGENPDVRVIVDGRRPLESLLTLWVGQSAADLLSAVQAGIYGVLDCYDLARPAGLSRSQVVTEINLRYIQWTLLRQELFVQEELSPAGELPIPLHYAVSLFCWLLLSLAPLFAWNYQGAWPAGYRRLQWAGRSVLVGLAASLTVCGLLTAAVLFAALCLLGAAPPAAALAALLTALFSAAFAAACAMVTSRAGSCGALTFLLSLAALLLSGGLIPSVLLPPPLQRLLWLSPITWMRALAAWAMGYQAAAGPAATALAGTCAALLLLSAIRYRRRCMKEVLP